MVETGMLHNCIFDKLHRSDVYHIFEICSSCLGIFSDYHNLQCTFRFSSPKNIHIYQARNYFMPEYSMFNLV